MKTIHIIMIIFFSLLIIVSLILIFYKLMNEKIKKLEFRISIAEDSLLEKLKDKHTILLNMIKIIEEKTKIKSKTFNQISKIKEDKISFNSDTSFEKCFIEIKNIYENESKTKKLKEKIIEYEDIELHIVSLRTYYNKYTLIYNNLIKKFPYIIVSTIKKYRFKNLFEGEELEIENKNIIEV